MLIHSHHACIHTHTHTHTHSHMHTLTLTADPNESLMMRRSGHISPLELISSPVWDNSAESTAQKLLQHMATQLIGNKSRENLNMSQMVSTNV